VPIRLLDDLDDDDLTRLGGHATLWCYQNILVDASVFRYDKRDSVLDEHSPDDLAVRPFEDFDDDPLTTSPAIDADDAHQSPITM